MADEDKQQEQTEQKTEAAGEAASSGAGLFVWLIVGAVALGCAVGGFALAQLVAGTGDKTTNTDEPTPTPPPANGTDWQYELPPVIGNLDEPGVTRYLRVTVILVVSGDWDKKEGVKFFNGEEGGSDGKKLLLIDFLSDYISGLTLERVRGQRNRGRMKKELTEGFNELLFPNRKPLITSILFKEFAVQ